MIAGFPKSRALIRPRRGALGSRLMESKCYSYMAPERVGYAHLRLIGPQQRDAIVVVSGRELVAYDHSSKRMSLRAAETR